MTQEATEQLTAKQLFESQDKETQDAYTEIAGAVLDGVSQEDLCVLYDLAPDELEALVESQEVQYALTVQRVQRKIGATARSDSLDDLESKAVSKLHEHMETALEVGETLAIAKFANSAVRRDSHNNANGVGDITRDALQQANRVVLTLNQNFGQQFQNATLAPREHKLGENGAVTEVRLPQQTELMEFMKQSPTQAAIEQTLDNNADSGEPHAAEIDAADSELKGLVSAALEETAP